MVYEAVPLCQLFIFLAQTSLVSRILKLICFSAILPKDLMYLLSWFNNTRLSPFPPGILFYLYIILKIRMQVKVISTEICTYLNSKLCLCNSFQFYSMRGDLHTDILTTFIKHFPQVSLQGHRVRSSQVTRYNPFASIYINSTN